MVEGEEEMAEEEAEDVVAVREIEGKFGEREERKEGEEEKEAILRMDRWQTASMTTMETVYPRPTAKLTL